MKTVNHLAPFTLLGTPPGTCKECAVVHEAAQPHNQQSLAYQYYFYNERGRWPNWGDAMAHCKVDVKAAWKAALMKKGVEESAFEE